MLRRTIFLWRSRLVTRELNVVIESEWEEKNDAHNIVHFVRVSLLDSLSPSSYDYDYGY
jgi:hypothetical protein